MNNPLPIWCVCTKRNTLLCRSKKDGPILFVRLDEANKGIEKIAKRFKLATLLATFFDANNSSRFAGWEAETADSLKLPAGAITLRHLRDNEAKIRAELAAGNDVKVAKKSTRTKKVRRRAPATV